MKELVVISGKGGTGKTSLVASFAALAAGRAVLADCDVDAADLHLVLSPDVRQRHNFYGGHHAVIRQDLCIGCGQCVDQCRFGAVVTVAAAECRDCDFCVRSCALRAHSMVRAMMEASGKARGSAFEIDPAACEGCGVCEWFCPAKAIEMRPRLCGQWMISETRCGPMVHARLAPGAENSGKLVSTVRSEARKLAEQRGLDTILIDGSPGIGCPVIASIGGAGLVLIVAEPTLSAMHDLERVADLARHFDVPVMVCVNKWDLNPQLADDIEALAGQRRLGRAGRVRYDAVVTQAQLHGLSAVEHAPSPCADDIRALWATVRTALEGPGAAA